MTNSSDRRAPSLRTRSPAAAAAARSTGRGSGPTTWRCGRRNSASGSPSPGPSTPSNPAGSASACCKLGLAPGQSVAVIGENCKEWAFAELGVGHGRRRHGGRLSDIAGRGGRLPAGAVGGARSSCARTRSRSTRCSRCAAQLPLLRGDRRHRSQGACAATTAPACTTSPMWSRWGSASSARQPSVAAAACAAPSSTTSA